MTKRQQIEKLPLLEGKVRFKVKDADGIHQVRLLVMPTDEIPPPGYQLNNDSEKNKMDWQKHIGKIYVLHDHLSVNAEKEATVEFNYPKFAKNLIEVKIIDGHGNMVYRELKLVEKKENTISNLIRHIFRR